MTSSSDTAKSFGRHYSKMSEDEILRLASDVVSLVPNAKEALRAEIERRQLAVDGVDWTAQPAPEGPRKSDGSFRRFFRNLSIFVVCGVGYLVFLAFLLSHISGIDIENFSREMTGAVLRLSVALAVITMKPGLIPKRFIPESAKSIWILGICAPPAAFLWLAAVRALHLGSFVRAIFWPAVIAWVVYGWFLDRRVERTALRD